MDSDFFSALGWREGLMAIIGLLAVYVVFISLRVHGLRQAESRARNAPLTFTANAAVTAYGAAQAVPPVNEALAQPGELGTPDFPFPWNEPPADSPLEQRVARQEIEIEQLRKEVGGLRAEVLVLREALQYSAASVSPKSSVAELIAPQYSEAMQLARKRIAPDDISRQCGITRAEAELVAALVKNHDN